MTRRLPAEIKAARGTLRPSREAKTPPPRLIGEPKRPDTLKGAGAEMWTLMCKLLAARHQLGVDSGPALAALCDAYHLRDELARELEANGRFQLVTTTKGDQVRRPHPAAAMYRDADSRYRSWLLEFGLTDASRGKVNAVFIQEVARSDPKPAKPKTMTTAEKYGL